MKLLLRVEHLSKHFSIHHRGQGGWRAFSKKIHKPSALYAVDDVSFDVHAGDIVGIVGESGCGKSTLVRLLTRLMDPSQGHILFNDKHIGDVPAHEFAFHSERAQIQKVFQDPTDSLNPHYTAFDCIADPIRRLAKVRDRQVLRARVEEVAEQVALPVALLNRYPHQLSGGQKLRVGIARGIALHPTLLILDEPTSALDVSVQAIVLQLLARLQRELDMTYLFVSHDLNVVRLLCNRVMVMYLGKVVESGPADAIFSRPMHPYTQALLAAVPTLDPQQSAKRLRLSDEPHSPIDPPPHVCRFFSRCPKRMPYCAQEMPLLRGDTHQVACHLGAAT